MTTEPNPGRTEEAHRLNRAEYQNAVRDLLAVDLDLTSVLPGDDSGEGGFDNMGDVLTVSPVLFRQYMSAASKIARIAIGVPNPRPISEMYSVPQSYLQEDRMSGDLPFGSFGGTVVRHTFPAKGEYQFKIRLQRTYNDCIRGLARRHQLELRIDGTLIKEFSIGGDAPGVMAPIGLCGGTLGLRTDWDNYMTTADDGLEVRVPVLAGTHAVGVSFVRDLIETEGAIYDDGAASRDSNSNSDERWHGRPAVEHLFITGPYDTDEINETASRRQILTCRPTRAADETRCATQILSKLARRAYRRPVTNAEVKTLLTFYETGRKQDDFESGIRLALERLLVDPSFLFRFEPDPAKAAPGAVARVSDLALASRLSFFLWSSIPDEELLDLAARGKLSDPAVLERQTRRMLADKRSKALVENFFGQWLSMRNVRDLTPDPDLFEDFDGTLQDAFRQETMLFVESQVAEDRGILDLLTANYTFVNERLARHYGMKGIYGSHFRRVPTDEKRGGILGHAGVLAVTSYPNRTSPVLRGRWILDNLLGSPPPEPPPDVPTLPAKGEGGKPTSVRDRLETHRKNPVCATCHAQMDPLGFALENFDAVGQWRTTDEGNTKIDASGVYGGKEIQGLAGLRGIFVEHPEDFVRTVSEKLLAYAVGRPTHYYDRPAIRAITRAASPDYRWSSIILGIIQSKPFQMRRAES
jgi:hypothetical protein